VPVQLAARFAAGAPASTAARDLERDVNRAAAEVSRDLATSTAAFAGDPKRSALEELEYRTRFLDPGLARPRFSLAGARSIERSGGPETPRYRYTATAQSEAREVRESVCEFRVEAGRLRSVAYDEWVRGPDERVIEERHLDFAKTYRDKATASDVPWPDNVYPAPCLELVLAALPFATAKLVHFHVWTDLEPAAPMIAVVDGIETVTVPAGRFEAYRVRMRFDEEAYLARLKLPAAAGYDVARSMMEQLRLPRTVFWVSVEEPRRILRAEGPLGPPGVTRGVVELVSAPRPATSP
jgi:hypothetical protein